eukprot:TRINITY_DN3661_c0_g1_i2.p1 TRINITY_DN3661_c0_g1~~TRINITY_DN3661_c0_g1_i2.p1  ORF type:complete len:409 (-),score=136.20 TRINITY_DN3661_c0_g1_i2:448-1674(-)
MLKYNLEEKVGEGAYGEVFRARRKEDGKIVAIKKLFVTEGDEGVSYTALQEIKYLNQLKDANLVVDLYETFFEQQGKELEKKKDALVMVLPYYKNDLNGALPAFQRIEHIKCGFKQILEGVNQIHSRNLMHRDLKPANILFQDGNISIADLGMMANYKATTEFPSNVVTLWYRSPELLLGQEKYGPEVDIWSCGILFIELMTRKSPFPGKEEYDQLNLTMKIMGQDYINGSEGMETFPFYQKMMHDAKKRFPLHSQIRMVFKAWPVDALDLLEKMLCPSKNRLTASQLLEHPFFQNEPKPCLPNQIPKVEALHEYEMKKKRKNEEAAAQSQSQGKRPCNNGPQDGQMRSYHPNQYNHHYNNPHPHHYGDHNNNQKQQSFMHRGEAKHYQARQPPIATQRPANGELIRK